MAIFISTEIMDYGIIKTTSKDQLLIYLKKLIVEKSNYFEDLSEDQMIIALKIVLKKLDSIINEKNIERIY